MRVQGIMLQHLLSTLEILAVMMHVQGKKIIATPSHDTIITLETVLVIIRVRGSSCNIIPRAQRHPMPVGL